MFSVRIVTTDHYQSTPIPGLDVQYSDLKGSDVWKVPVVRIYGSTQGGQKTCMHVHGVFPYLYVPYDGTQPWDRYLRLFANSLDKALNVSLNHANSKSQHVYKINLVSGIPMYGYHDKEEQFLKIFLYNPGMIRKAADLLLGGAVMNKAFQPHESHIPYVLQMFIDYNLYGMNMLNVAAVKFRRQNRDDNGNPVERVNKNNMDADDVKSSQDNSCPRTPTSLFDRSELLTPSRKRWENDNIPEDLYLDESVTRQSTCELECDIVAPDILNRQEVDANIGTNPGLAALWEDEKQRKRNMGESSQIAPPDSQEREEVEISESDELLRLKFLQIIQNHQPYMDSQTEEESQDLSIPDVTPASALDLQLSQDDLSDASQVTVLVEDEEEDEVKPIISVDSIKRVVSTSQSFTGSQGSQPQADTQDKSLAEILASLANESSPSSSQEVSEQITALEEKDSILLDKSEPINDEIAKQLEEETLEMSQVVWDNDGKGDEEIPGPSNVDYNMEGLDDSWNISQFLRKEEEESDDNEDVIPQFDGSIDEKPDKEDGESKKKKRLDVRGPVVGNQGPGYHGNIAHNQGNQYSQQHGYNNQILYQNWQQPSHTIPKSYYPENKSNQSTLQSMENINNEGRSNHGNVRHFHGNQARMPSPQYTGSQQQPGFASSYGNLQSPSPYASPHSNYGNTQNHHGSYSNLSSTSSRSNIQSPHDSSHGSLHSPALSSHSNMQSPSQISSQFNTHDSNHVNIKSPINEDSRDSVYSTKDCNSAANALPMSQASSLQSQQGNQQRNSQSLQKPIRMSPSPELHDDFTIHHFSKGLIRSAANQGQTWSNQQRSHIKQSPDHHGDMQSPQFGHPMTSTHQSQFHQMSQPTSSQHPFASDFDHDQYRGLQSMFKSNVQQQVPYNNQIIASQSSYNELSFQPTMFNQQHQQGSSTGDQKMSQSAQPYTSPNDNQLGQLTPMSQQNVQSGRPYSSPTGQQQTQFAQPYSSPTEEQGPQMSQPFSTSDSQQQLYSPPIGQHHIQSGQPFSSPSSQQQTQSSQMYSSPSCQQNTSSAEQFSSSNDGQFSTFTQPYILPDSQPNPHTAQPYFSPKSQQNQTMTETSENMSPFQMSQAILQDGQQTAQSHFQHNQMQLTPKGDNHQEEMNTNSFRETSFHQLLSEDQQYSSMQSCSTPSMQSQLSPSLQHMNQFGFQQQNHQLTQLGQYRMNEQNQAGLPMHHQFKGPFPQQQSAGGYYPMPHGFSGELNNPRMQIRAKVSKRGRRPKNSMEHITQSGVQHSMTEFDCKQQVGNPRMPIPGKAKRGRRPKHLTQQNPHLGEQALQQQFMAGFDGRQHPFSDPNGNPGMQVPPKPKRGRRPKSMTEPNAKPHAKFLQAAVMEHLQKKNMSSDQNADIGQKFLFAACNMQKSEMSLAGQKQEMSMSSQNLEKPQEMSLAQQNLLKQQDLSMKTPNLQRIPSAIGMMTDNKSFMTETKSDSKNNDGLSQRQPTTLERLLLYGDEGVDKDRYFENTTEKGSQGSKTSEKSDEKTSEIVSPQPSNQQISQSFSPNGSADLFSDSSQSSLSSKPVMSTPATAICDTSINRKSLEQENESICKTSDRSSLSSLASLVCNVSPASRFGYQYNNPVASGESNIFISPEPYNKQISNSTSQNIVGLGNKSPSHINLGNKSPSHFGFESKFSNHSASGQYKSPNHMGIGGHKSPNHFGFMRSISCDGSQQYDNRGPAVPPGLSNNDDNDMISSQESNSSYSSNINNSWSGYSPQNQSPNFHSQHESFIRSQSFSFDKKVRGRSRKSFQQSRCWPSSVSKKPPPPPNAAYTFTFHVPTPVYKRLKLTHHRKPQSDDIKIVRMHPRDARRYSLLKIGRGIVKAKKLTQADIDKSGVVLRAPLDELLIEARNTQRHTTGFSRSLSYNSDMKAPYDIKTEKVMLNCGISGTNHNFEGIERVKWTSEIDEGDQSLFNNYPQKMVVPSPQTLAESSEDCHDIRKVTLTSIIENVLISSMKNDSETSEKDVKNEGDHCHRNDNEGTLNLTKLLTNDLAGKDASGQYDLDMMQNKKKFENQDSKLLDKEVSGSNNSDIKIQNQSLQNTSSAIIPNQISGSLVNVMFPSNMARNFTSNVRSQKDNIENCGQDMMVVQNQITDGCDSISTVQIPKSSGQVCRKIEKQPRRKNLMLCRKRSMNKMLTSSPSVIDPDLDDHDVILKDVSLIEASEGTLTPIKSRTPVAGRSPIRHHAGDAYKLFDGELLNLKDDIENKLKDFEGSNNTKIFPTILSEKDSGSSTDTAAPSVVSSRTSSRTDSSESVASLQLVSKESENRLMPVVNGEDYQKEKLEGDTCKKSINLNSAKQNSKLNLPLTTDDSENFNSIPKITISENSDLNTRSTKNHENVPILNEEEGLRKRKASSFSSDSNSDPSDFKDEQKKVSRKKMKEKENIDNNRYSGKFKGCKQMMVSLSKIDMENKSAIDGCILPDTHANLTVNYGLSKWTKVKTQDNCYSDISSDSSQDMNNGKYQSPIIKPSSLIDMCTSNKCGGYFESFRKFALNGQTDINQKKKKTLSLNHKLSVAFLSKKRKLKKSPKITGKIKGLNSIKGLSLLHEATLANLTDTTGLTTETKSQTDNVLTDSGDESKDRYDDVLYKMALYSSPDTDSLDSIPPQPFSPEELSRDQQGLTRSTSDAQSPVLESESSASPSNSNVSSTDSKILPVNPSNFPKLIIDKENSDWIMKVPKEVRHFNVSCCSKENETIISKEKQSDFVFSSEEKNYSKNSLKNKKVMKKAVVKLKRLTLNEIDKYTGKEYNKTRKNISESPPDLGPPNIPKYPNGTSIDECDSPPKLSEQENSPVYQVSETCYRSSSSDDSNSGSVIKNDEIVADFCRKSVFPANDNNSAMKTFSSCSSLSCDSNNSSDGPPIITEEKFGSTFSSTEESFNTSHHLDLNTKMAIISNASNFSDINLVETVSTTSFNCKKHKIKPAVIKPKLIPPSRQHVTDTAISHGLNLANNQEAFCSNPDDVPDKPRELGGRILKIESPRVSDLMEFSSGVQNDGLSTWRQILSAGDQLFDSDNLLERVNKEPQLRFALMGDKSVTITPCNPAPSCKKVTDWMIGRHKYKNIQLNGKETYEKQNGKVDKNIDNTVEIHCDKTCKTVKPNNLLNSVSFSEPCDKKLSFSVCDTDTLTNHNVKKSCDTFKSTNLTNHHNLENSENLSNSLINSTNELSVNRSVLEEINDNTDEDDMIGPSPPDSTQPMSQLCRTISDRPIKKLKLFSSQHKGEFTPSFSNHRSRFISPSPTIMCSQRSIVGKSPSLHSTPVTKNRHCDLILPACTPINHLDTQKEFVTPKRVPLAKRTSVGSGKDMRKSLMSSQLQQFATPDQKNNISQIDGPTPKNSFGFQISQQNFQDAKALHEVQNLTVLSMELLAETVGDHLPDPEVDSIQALFYTILNDVHPDKGTRETTGVIMVDAKSAKSQKEQEKLQGNRDNTSLPPRDSCISPSTPSSTPGSQKPSTSKDTRHYTPIKPLTPDSQKPSTSKDSGNRKLSPSRSRSPTPSAPASRSPKVSSSSTSKNSGNRKSSPSRSRSPTPRSSKVSSSSPSSSPVHTSVPIDQTVLQRSGVDGKLQVTYVEKETDLFQSFIDLVMRWDPDIFVGYEIQKVSWGYLLQRAAQLGINLCSKISRIPEEKRNSHFSAQKDEYGADHMSEIHIVGRIVLNLWRIIKHEVTLNIYTFENVMYHVLHQRVPKYSVRSLNSWYNHRTHLYRWRVVNYFTTRVQANLQIMEQVDLIGRTGEFARVFGIEFFHVLSRGSQYRVESMMLRLAKPMNFIPVSPNVHQRARMKAPECIQLVLEPESRFYHDPVVVVDFQSLYPSIMIAYNYCFSTCVGRIGLLEKAHEGAIEFGCTHLKIPPSVLKKIKDDVTVSPNGVVFVKQHVRKGIISAMVEEILSTRLMVKKAMKEHKNDKTLHRLLDARQMGLKLIANVTYGYTAANFSGRMPCVEVGDSIVRKARETLERSIKLVEDTPRWGAKVVYGDTDSMFIQLKGRSKDDAFKIGYEICDAVTAMHPSPIKLRFEKVYLPCVLQTKKRYVGFSYETPEQKEPIYDAKGIETVRRDACPAVSKILERSIKILFSTKDVSQVKQYVQNQCRKLMEGKVSMMDLIFAKEYRGMPGYKPGACVPSLEISRKLLRSDRRSEPCVGERVPYVIVYGSPGLPLIQLVKQPSELLTDPSLRINATYYITKQILPPLGRMLSLLGVDVFSWYNDMPKIVRIVPQSLLSTENKKGTISQYFASSNCPVCDKLTNQTICNNCIKDPQTVAIVLNDRIRKWETVFQRLVEICNSCMGTQDEKQPCTSLDCPIIYRRSLASRDNHKGTQLREALDKCLDF